MTVCLNQGDSDGDDLKKKSTFRYILKIDMPGMLIFTDGI